MKISFLTWINFGKLGRMNIRGKKLLSSRFKQQEKHAKN